MSFLNRPQTAFARRALFQVHLWIGVLAGLYVFVVCVTGAVLVFRIDIQRALHPHLFTPRTSGAPADPVAILATLERAFPDDRVSGLDAPTTVRPTYLAYLSRGDQFLTLLLDPVSAEILGEVPEDSFVRTVQDLHFDLLGGRRGRLVNGAGAMLLGAMCLTGLVIWWPGRANWRRGFAVDIRRPWRRVNWDLHSAVGIWMVTLIAMWAATGVYLTYPNLFRAVVHRISPLTRQAVPQSDVSNAAQRARPWRAVIDEARRHVPGQHVARVVFPSSERATLLVMFAKERPTAANPDLTAVYLDRYSGAVSPQPPPAARTAGDLVMAWAAPLHVGNFGGGFVRVAWLVLGLSPPVLFVTGFAMWWTRVVRRRL